MSLLSRRNFLTKSLATIFGACGLVSCTTAEERRADSQQLNIFSWADYLHPEAIPEFEKRYGIKVVYDTFASNESLLARMSAGSVDYDIIVPSNYAVTKLKKLNVLQAIDKEKVPNLKYMQARFKTLAYDPGNQYSIPYTYGTTGIGYNKDAFAQLGLAAPTDWDAFWNQALKGRITLLEDARETIGLALKRAGHSYNSVQEAEIQAAKNDMVGQKPLTMCYTSDQVIIYLASGDSRLSLAYSGDAHQARRTNPSVEYAIPKSGASLWIDNLCIPKSAPHVDNALKWIDYIYDPETSAALSNFTYYPTPNQGALKFVKKELLQDQTLYLSESELDRCEEIKDIGDGIFLYDRAWTELKCV